MGTINGHIFNIDGAHGILPPPQNTMSALNGISSEPGLLKYHAAHGIWAGPGPGLGPRAAGPGLGPAQGCTGPGPRPGPGPNAMDRIVFSAGQALN